MTFVRYASLALAVTLVAGCNPPPPGAGQDTGGISKQDIGTVLGGVGGAVIGSQFGGGSGRLVGTAAGAVIGGLAGNSIGRSLDQADAYYYQQATQRALETAPPGQQLPWRNPQSGNYGYVVPQAPYRSNGHYCREFQQTIYISGQPQQGYGKACRQPDGSWKIVQ